MATQKKEDQKHFTPSNSLIECTGCPCGISNLISTTPTVFVKKKPMATIKDGLPSSFLPFPTCSLSLTNTCIPAPIGEWETQGELKKIDIERQTPIIEGNRIKCQAQTGIGTITISEKTSTPPPPENVVDKAQNKINKAANSVTKKITEVAQDASDAINDIAGGAKKVGGFLKNESIQGAVSNTSNFVDNVDRKKAELDATVGNINIRLENLRKELKELITGEQQELQDLMTVQDKSAPKDDNAKTEEENAVPESNEENKAEEEKEELKYNQDFFDQANQESVNAFLNSIEEDVNTLTVSSEAGKTPRNFETITAENSSTRLFTDEPPSTNTKNSNSTSGAETANNIVSSKSDKENLEEILNNNEKSDKDYTDIANSQYTEANTTLGNYDAEPLPQDEESLQALALLNRLTDPNPPTDSSTIILNALPASNKNNQSSNPFEARINEERTELNTKVQAEIDEVLSEIKYLERTQKYQQESKELQEDIDRSAAALDVLGDFDAFIDGIAAKHLGRLAGKYKQVMDQMGKNMSRLNDSLRGTSFMTGGFKAGDVVTHAPDLPKEKEEEKEEDTATPVLPPPVTIVDPPPKEKEPEEETPEETDECTFTKLTVIKNKTLEYVVLEKENEKVIQNNNIEYKYIRFISGTTPSKKQKFVIEVENLNRSSQHKRKKIEYHVEDDIEEVPFPDGNPKIQIPIRYKEGFLDSEELFLSNFMGIRGEIKSTLYHIPIPLCGYNKTINLFVYPDAEWSFVFSVKSKDPLTYKYSSMSPGRTFMDRMKKAEKTGMLNSESLQENSREGELKIGYFVEFNEGSRKLNLSKSVDTIYASAKKLFSFVGAIDRFSDSLLKDHDNDNTDRRHLRTNVVSIEVSPPAVSLGIKNKLVVEDKNIFDPLQNQWELDIKLDPIIATDIEIDVIQASLSWPIILLLVKTVEKFTDRPLSDVLYFFIGLHFNFKLEGNMNFRNNTSEAKTALSATLDIRLGLNLKGSFIGIEYEASIEGKLAGTFVGEAKVVYDKQFYSEASLNFNGIEANFIIEGSVKGWILEKKVSKEFKTVLFAWDNPWSTGKLALSGR
ncbi:hypothetical protein [uncultured Aquimarina sp.]|uniref:hypothetical protein n=1 Tax=uncultured Aquimarina sp. TaxID=575652 RepID=UPI00261FF4C5|nr:hypothetical protein [uncultured Aquimarina sp.]